MRLLPLIVLLLFALPAVAQDTLPPLEALTADNAASLQPLARLGRGVVRDVQWSPDGTTLGIATTLGAWLQAADPAAEPRLIEGQSGTSAIAFSPDGGTLASGGDDGSVLLVDRADATERQRADRHIYAIGALGYSADGTWLASADASGVVRVWQADRLREHAVFQASGVPWAVALNGDGSAVAVSTRAGVEVWRVDGGNAPVARWPLPGDAATRRVSLQFTGAESIIFAHDTTLYAARIGQAEVERTELDAPVIDLPVGAQPAVVTLRDRRFEVHALDGGERMAVLDDPDRSVERLRFSPDWTRAVSIGSGGPRLRLWSLTDRANTAWLEGYSGPLTGLVPAGAMLAAVDDAGSVTLWDRTSGRRVTTFETWTRGEPEAALAASPNGQLIATGGDDSIVRLFDAVSGEAFRLLHGHIRSVTALAFSADSRLLASGSLDGAIHVWDVQTGALLARLSGHTAGVTGLVLDADVGLLASSSHDGTVRLWGVPQVSNAS